LDTIVLGIIVRKIALSGDVTAALRTFLEDLADDLDHISRLLTAYAEGDAARREAAAPGPPTALNVSLLIGARRARAATFGLELANAGWSLLLELYRARLAGEPGVRINRLAVDARVAPATVARWLGRLIAAGLAERVPDGETQNGVHARLTPDGAAAMQTHFEAAEAARLVG
jgi:DNA-binding MarR family transcriptional regulator